MSKKPETIQPTSANGEESKPKPVAEVRLGDVCAAIWANRTDKGVMYNATFVRRYKVGEKKWRSTNSFGRDDLTLLSIAVGEAASRINELMAQDAVK
ncbi:MAG: hypothetical protein KDA16_00880 [Phycisphaerales bacterium]|nr:hypothetical protein [Phycisphaerales bacterium]